jgi:hypothetical protein
MKIEYVNSIQGLHQCTGNYDGETFTVFGSSPIDAIENCIEKMVQYKSTKVERETDDSSDDTEVEFMEEPDYLPNFN